MAISNTRVSVFVYAHIIISDKTCFAAAAVFSVLGESMYI